MTCPTNDLATVLAGGRASFTPPRPTTAPFPFADHRTVAEVDAMKEAARANPRRSA